MAVIPTNPLTFYLLAEDLLEDAVQVLTDNAIQLPSHRFISWHAPAWDCCDHLVVHLGAARPNRASTAQQLRRATHYAGVVVEADIVLTFVGCAAIGDPTPLDSDMNLNAKTMLINAWVLYQGLICAWGNDTLFKDFTSCRLVKVGPLAPHPPMGGCESFTITFTVEIS